MALFLVNIVGLIIFYTGFSEDSPTLTPGDMNIAVIGGDIVLYATFFQIALISWYVNSVSVGPIVSEEYYPRCSYLFFHWDRMNRRIIPEESRVGPTATMTFSHNLA